MTDAEARWRLAFQASGDGVWDWDIRTDRVVFSDGLMRMLGYEAGEPWDSLRDWSDRVHPDDLPVAMAAVQAHLDGGTPTYVNEHRLKCADGRWKWILDRGVVTTRDAEGRPLRMIGSHTDISAIREARDVVERERKLLFTVLEHAPLGIGVTPLDGDEAIYVNGRFDEICGIPRGSITSLAQSFAVVHADPAEREAAERRIRSDIEANPLAPHRWADMPFTMANGERRWVTTQRIPLPEHGLVLWTLENVTAEHAAAETLRRQAHEVSERNRELLQFNRAAIDRELRMIELKQEVNHLLARLGEPPRYDVTE
ncbi:MAG: PAS domain-containing protein [Acidobacteria bacterium]|nr:PAS domain-containing protein [Acidobacteriota bacterium]